MAVVIVKCKMAGKDIKTRDGFQCACKFCSGVIEVDSNGSVTLKGKALYATLPRKGLTDFTCPLLLKNPLDSEVIER